MATQIALPIIDTSRYDANKGDGTYVPIDWFKAKEKWTGAIVKAGEGNFVDPAYDEQVVAIKTAGALWGSYFMFRTYYNAIAEAHLFCDQIERYGGYGALGVWLDVEYNSYPTPLPGKQYLALVASCLNEIRNRVIAKGVKVPVGIYTRNSFFDPLWIEAGRPTWPKLYPYMQAWYMYNGISFPTTYDKIVHQNYLPPIPAASVALGPCVLHQWTDKGRPIDVPGYPPYKQSIDFNLVYKKYWDDQPVSFPTTPYRAKTTMGINFRSGPSTTATQIGLVFGASEVVVTDDSNPDFSKIEGYVSKQYLEKV